MKKLYCLQCAFVLSLGYSNKTKTVEELNQNNTTMNGSSNDCCDTTPVIRAPEDSDVEMETQDDVHNTCNGKNGSSNGYQNGNSHTICEDGYEDEEDDDMGGENFQKSDCFVVIVSLFLFRC